MSTAQTSAATAAVEDPPGSDRRPRGSRLPTALRSPYVPIWLALAALLVVSPAVAPGSLGAGALTSTLPFASVLVLVAVGQTLVIQQRGLDLSVPGVVSLSAVVVTTVGGEDDTRLGVAVLAALAATALAGLVSGLAVTVLRVTPLVATLGVNALLLGSILQVTNGTQTSTVPPALSDFAFRQFLGLPSLALVAAAVVAVVAVIQQRTTVGRRFVAVGTSAPAARAAGMPVRSVVTLTYVIAALLGGVAGILLAGYLRTPGLSTGDAYLLPSIAAVVLGGTALTGGRGSVLGTVGGALFLTQLQQVAFGAGAPTSLQLLLQSAAIALGMALRAVPWARIVPGRPEPARAGTRPTPAPDRPPSTAPEARPDARPAQAPDSPPAPAPHPGGTP